MAGRELAGLTVEAIHWDRPEVSKLEFQQVVKTLQIDYVERQVQYSESRTYHAYSRLLLPLAGPFEGAPAQVLLSVVDLSRRRAIAERVVDSTGTTDRRAFRCRASLPR